MGEDEIVCALQSFVEPAAFREAAAILESRSIVVLHGRVGTGKRTGALALLRHDAQRRPIIVLSPGLSAEELRCYDYKPGRDYLILDRTGGKDDATIVAYNFGELAKELAKGDARLVLTTTAPRSEFPDEFIVLWVQPGVNELIDRYIADRDTAARVLGAVGAAAPREVAWIAEQLDRMDGAQGTIDRILEHAGLHTVTRWLEGDPPEPDILLVVAVCFSTGLTETECETMLAQLEATIESDQPKTDGESAPQTSAPIVRQRRRDRLAAIPILVRHMASDSAAANTELSLTFTSPASRRGILEQLWDRYDLALWGPVRSWLDAIIESADDRTTVSVTAGLALLAKAAPQYVLTNYLGPWAERPGNPRRAACYVIWHAAYDGSVSSWALDCALAWARSPYEDTKSTAVLCLAGPIGMRYPAEATRRLWRLSRAQGVLGAEARNAIITLTRNAALADNADLTPLRYIASQLAGSPSSGRNSRFETALRVSDVLMATNDTNGQPLTAAIAELPDAAPTLGRIWAAALVHRPHRRAALNGLARALAALGESDRGLDAIRALGPPLLNGLSAPEQQLLRRELPPRLASIRAAASNSQAIISALLESIPNHRSGNHAEEGP